MIREIRLNILHDFRGLSPDQQMTIDINSFKEYSQFINDTVDIIIDEYEESLKEEPANAIWETVDSSEMIIYYSNNMDILQYSQNEPEEWEHLVSDGDSWKEVIQAMAYRTMEIDIWEELNDRDIELN